MDVTLIILLVVATIVFLATCIPFFVINGGALKTKRVVLFYVLFLLLFAGGGFLGAIPGSSESMLYFSVILILYFLLGYLACFLLKGNFFGDLNRPELSKVLFVISHTALGMVPFSLIFNHFSQFGIAPFYTLALIAFIVPQCLATSFASYVSIPQEIYKIWYFPEEEIEIDFDQIDTSKVYMLEMEFSKSIDDNRVVNSKAKAPLGMRFGDWFMSFIENYNHKFDREPIQYLYSNNTSQGWIFYVKPSFFGTPRYIDPDLTITENKISEKNVIIARRAGVVV